MRPLDVEPEQLRSAAAGVRQAGERLELQWQRLRATADGMGDVFGGDEVGGLIGASYRSAQQIAERSVTSVVGAFTGFGDGLASMGDAYDAVEERNAALFHRLG
ncbi:WXG100 family type VII secretion target [Micromonospora sp. NPDC049497]|uniref:WXG100 family type VII secretion target n=1 Tax=Micromonospora sp. NPDC049497 TaxID=3364273 RepID=UPI00378B259E